MIRVVDRVPTYPNRIKITRQDGTSVYVTWERADEPTVVGTPINKALFDSIAADIGLSANITIYVSTAGSDTLGNGTASNKYATIQKAINSLPRNLNGFDATISIADGTYEEDVLIARTYGGNIVLTGTEGANVSIRSLRVSYGSAVRVQNIALSVTGNFNNNAVAVTAASFICTSKLALSGTVENGIYVNYDGYVCLLGDLTISNTTYAAINVTNRSSFFASSINGTVSEGTFARSVNGSMLAYNVMNATAPIMTYASAGGRIYTGAQTEVPNY